jgi:hypothetical protein
MIRTVECMIGAKYLINTSHGCIAVNKVRVTKSKMTACNYLARLRQKKKINHEKRKKLKLYLLNNASDSPIEELRMISSSRITFRKWFSDKAISELRLWTSQNHFECTNVSGGIYENSLITYYGTGYAPSQPDSWYY